MTGVKLKLVGKAETQFDVGSGRAKTYHSQREVYIDEKIYLAGYGESQSINHNQANSGKQRKIDSILKIIQKRKPLK